MEDRFKFRGIHPVLNELLEVKFIDYVKGTVDFGDGDIFLINDDIKLQQATGLKDKNGKLIYEGDILGGIYENLYIKYCHSCMQFELHCNRYGCMHCNGDFYWGELVEGNNKLRVIGNIYTNPELIKEGE